MGTSAARTPFGSGKRGHPSVNRGGAGDEQADYTYLDFAEEGLKPSSHYPFLKDDLRDLEWHFKPTEDDEDFDRCQTVAISPHDHRIPKEGDTAPKPNDRPIGYDPFLIKLFGTSWWDWRHGLTLGCFVDVDCGHGGSAHSRRKSPSGCEGGRVPLPPQREQQKREGTPRRHSVGDPQPARIRAEHKANCKRIVAKLCGDLGLISPKFFL